MKYLDPLNFCREVVKLPGPLLGLSANRKQVGLGYSDFDRTKARPLGTLAWNRKEPHLIAFELQTLISHSVSGLVIAHPFRPHNRCRPKGELLVDDITKTGKLQDVIYTFWDESETTKGYCKKMGFSPKKYPGRSVVFRDEWVAYELLKFFLLLYNNPRCQRTFETSDTWTFRGK